MRSGGWRTDRRSYLSALGGVATGAVRSGQGNAKGEEREGESDTVPWPEIEAAQLDDWREIERNRRAFEKGVSLAGVRGSTRTRIYGHERLQRRVERRLGVAFDRPLATFFGTRIALEGYFTAGVSALAISEEVEPEFVARMERRRIDGVREVDPAEPRPEVGGYGAQFNEYRGEYRVPSEVEVDARGDDREEVRVVERVVPIAGFYAVWKDGTATAYAAGGAYPATSDVRAASDTGGNGTDAHLDVGFDPERLRADLVALVESVE